MNVKTKAVINDIYYCNSVTDELNDIIEEELKKGENADFDLIDDCCRALEILNGNLSGETEVFSCFDAVKIIKKHNAERNKKILLSASCFVLISAVAVAVAFTKGDSTPKKSEISSGKANESVVLAQAEKTTLNSNEKELYTSQKNRVKKLKVMQPLGEGKMIFDNRDEINIDDFYVYVEFVDGGRYSVLPSECGYEVLETADDGATRVRVTYSGYETFIYVTVRMPEIYTTEYYYPDWECEDNGHDFFDDDLFTEDETSATIKETLAEETTVEEAY